MKRTAKSSRARALLDGLGARCSSSRETTHKTPSRGRKPRSAPTCISRFRRVRPRRAAARRRARWRSKSATAWPMMASSAGPRRASRRRSLRGFQLAGHAQPEALRDAVGSQSDGGRKRRRERILRRVGADRPARDGRCAEAPRARWPPWGKRRARAAPGPGPRATGITHERGLVRREAAHAEGGQQRTAGGFAVLGGRRQRRRAQARAGGRRVRAARRPAQGGAVGGAPASARSRSLSAERLKPSLGDFVPERESRNSGRIH